jgi:hypothetical protein
VPRAPARPSASTGRCPGRSVRGRRAPSDGRTRGPNAR